MAITADLGGQKYVLGKGRVYFDRFAPNIVVTAATQGEGERFIGNAPEFSTTSKSEDLAHYASTGGIRVKDASVQLQLDRTGKFTCDNIDSDNLALYFLGQASSQSQASSASVVQVLPAVKNGRFYQLGASESLPQGHRKVTITTVKNGVAFADTVPNLAANYQLDPDLARLYIPEGSAILDDDEIQVTYAIAATTYEKVISATDTIYGAVRFVSDNPYGENKDYYLPYVKLAPDGDYSLIGDTWLQMGFTMEVLKKSSNIEAMYVTSRPT